MTTGVFVTAIGTDCGKTHVSCALLRQLVAQGRPALALKPLMTGFDPAHPEMSDAGRLLAAMGLEATSETLASVCWKSFPEPVAPNVAARRAGVALDYGAMLAFLRARMAGAEAVLVEGAGGVMSPLTDRGTNIDLICDLGLPVLLLAANYLGAISHTLTALEALDRRSLSVADLVVSQPWPHAGPPEIFAEELARWTALPITVAPFAREPADDDAWAGDLSRKLFG